MTQAEEEEEREDDACLVKEMPMKEIKPNNGSKQSWATKKRKTSSEKSGDK